MKIFLLIVFIVISADGAIEGDVCDAGRGANGVCRNIRRCPAAVEDIKAGRPTPPQCGWDNNDPVVCCKNAQTVTTTRKPALTTTKRSSVTTTTEHVPMEYDYISVDNKQGSNNGCEPIPQVMTGKPTGRKAWDKCLEYQEKYVFPCEKGVALSGDFGRVNQCHHNADELIIGGTAAGNQEFPHMALLGYLNDQSKIDWECGGSLISPTFVLTAGHCISNKLRNDVSHVLVGALNRNEASGSKRYGVLRIHKHPEYNSPHKYNDIALVQLNTFVVLDHTTVPACLDVGDSVGVDESRASVTGWGATVYNSQTSNADVLQKVVLTKFTTEECSKTYEPNRHMLNGVDARTQICYGDRTKSKDTCQGDSGGPLQVKNKKIVCMYTIIGVTSFGQACGWVGIPGIYTRVAPYVPWIENIVWPDRG